MSDKLLNILPFVIMIPVICLAIVTEYFLFRLLIEVISER